MKNPNIIGVKFLTVLLKFEVPVNHVLYDFGVLTLEKDGRNFSLDSTSSTLSDDEMEIEIEVEVDTDVIQMGVNSNYDLTAVDIMNGVKGSFYIGCEYEEEPTSITLFVKIGEMTKAIDLEID